MNKYQYYINLINECQFDFKISSEGLIYKTLFGMKICFWSFRILRISVLDYPSASFPTKHRLLN